MVGSTTATISAAMAQEPLRAGANSHRNKRLRSKRIASVVNQTQCIFRLLLPKSTRPHQHPPLSQKVLEPSDDHIAGMKLARQAGGIGWRTNLSDSRAPGSRASDHGRPTRECRSRSSTSDRPAPHSSVCFQMPAPVKTSSLGSEKPAPISKHGPIGRRPCHATLVKRLLPLTTDVPLSTHLGTQIYD